MFCQKLHTIKLFMYFLISLKYYTLFSRELQIHIFFLSFSKLKDYGIIIKINTYWKAYFSSCLCIAKVLLMKFRQLAENRMRNLSQKLQKFLADCRLAPEHFLISEKLKYLRIKYFLEAQIYQVFYNLTF